MALISDGSEPRTGSELVLSGSIFEKGLENWDFYVIKNRGPSRFEIELL